MARNTLVSISFALLALICFVHSTEASFDVVEYIEDRLQKTIKEENLTCLNYQEFCERSNKQFQTSNDPKAISANEMAIEMCKAILGAHLCIEDNSIA